MAKTRRDLLRERRDKELKSNVSGKKKTQPKDAVTSIGFIKGGLFGAGVGFVIGYATNQKAFFTVAGFLTGGYIAENLKRMTERKNETNPRFVNYKKRTR